MRRQLIEQLTVAIRLARNAGVPDTSIKDKWSRMTEIDWFQVWAERDYIFNPAKPSADEIAEAFRVVPVPSSVVPVPSSAWIWWAIGAAALMPLLLKK